MPAERIRKYQPRAEKLSDDTILAYKKREIRRRGTAGRIFRRFSDDFCIMLIFNDIWIFGLLAAMKNRRFGRQERLFYDARLTI